MMERMKNHALIPLGKCPVCNSPDVSGHYLEDRKYRYQCNSCYQYFEFNAKSQLQADRMWNDLFVR